MVWYFVITGLASSILSILSICIVFRRIDQRLDWLEEEVARLLRFKVSCKVSEKEIEEETEGGGKRKRRVVISELFSNYQSRLDRLEGFFEETRRREFENHPLAALKVRLQPAEADDLFQVYTSLEIRGLKTPAMIASADGLDLLLAIKSCKVQDPESFSTTLRTAAKAIAGPLAVVRQQEKTGESPSL